MSIFGKNPASLALSLLPGPTPEIIQLDQLFFPYPWTKEQWLEFDPEVHRLFVWESREILLGFALWGVSSYDNVSHLYKILLHPSYRGIGEAQAFWSEMEKKLIEMNQEKIFLEVGKENSRAINFYKKCGLGILREIRSYYSNGEDAFSMSKMLCTKKAEKISN